MSSIIRLPGLSVRERKQATVVLFSEKIAALTLKVNQDHWLPQWHYSVGHKPFCVCGL